MPPALGDCSHRPTCPGCPRWGRPGLAPGTARRLEECARDAGLPPPEIVEGRPEGFRWRSRLAVRGRRGTPKIGIFQAGSHRIADIPRCRIHQPRINEVVDELRAAVRETGIEPYRETGAGLLRYVQVAIARSDLRAQVVLVTCDRGPESIDGLAEALRARLGPRLGGLFWNGQPERTNAILGPHWAHLAGEPVLRDHAAGTPVCYPPGAFGQSHLELADRVVERVRAAVADGARVAEFHAGVGAIGLGLLERAGAVAFNEVSEHGLRGLEQALAERPAAQRARARVAPGPASTALGLLEEADVAIVDPPRRGLDPELRVALAGAAAERILYVSCGIDAFVRDAHELRTRGWRLADLTAYALFPYTEHVETLGVFER